MTKQTHSYFYDGVRTPIGKYRGGLSRLDAVDLGGLALKELALRQPAITEADGIIIGMTVQAGAGSNPARVAAHRAHLSLSIPAITLNNACLAGIDCMVDASRRVERGEGTAYIVGAMHAASRSPIIEMAGQEPAPAIFVDGHICALGREHVGVFSDRKNKELNISRERQDRWALRSQLRASAADFFSTGEIIPIETPNGCIRSDEAVRSASTLAALSALKAAFVEGGTITAGNAPPLADAAAVGVVAGQSYAERTGNIPLVRIVDWAYSAGPDWTLHRQPSSAVKRLLDKQGLKTSDVDIYEINEAFAGVVLAAIDDLRIPEDIVNPNGGAIAFGHPDAATATRLVLTLALELKRQGLRRGIATLCGGGGQGIAILLERAPDMT